MIFHWGDRGQRKAVPFLRGGRNARRVASLGWKNVAGPEEKERGARPASSLEEARGARERADCPCPAKEGYELLVTGDGEVRIQISLG